MVRATGRVVTMSSTMVEREPMPKLGSLLLFAAPYRGLLGLCTLLMLMESAAALAVPWLGGQLAGVLLPGGELGTRGPGVILAAMLLLFVIQAILKFADTYLLGLLGERIVYDLRVRLYDHLQSLPLGFFQQRRHGDTLALLTRDVDVFSTFLGGTLPSVIPLLFTVAGSLIMMFGIQPWLSLLVAAAIPAFYFVLKVIGRRLRPLAARLQDEQATAMSIAEENLGMLPAIKAFTREPQESVRFRQQADRILTLTRRQLKLHSAIEPTVQLVAAAGIVLLLWLAGDDLAGGHMTPGELVSFLLYAQLMTRPIAGLANVYGQTQTARGAAARLLRALEQPTENLSRSGRKLPQARGTIDYEGVSFAYPGRPPALRDLTLHVDAGEIVAVIGPNGAGKSTLAHLLMRLHDCDRGRILVDGVDIKTVSLASLRSQIGVVPQHVLLFNASVRDNLAYGAALASQQAVEKAARLARAHDFIEALPQGYDTHIGDRGVRLSGGQQQRLALARALLKDPPILILDEATAMFDPLAEAEFLEGARQALAGRTVLLITHRPASLAVADRTVRLEHGRVC